MKPNAAMLPSRAATVTLLITVSLISFAILKPFEALLNSTVILESVAFLIAYAKTNLSSTCVTFSKFTF